jgi:tetratricopeptide (TPR) repeat protein
MSRCLKFILLTLALSNPAICGDDLLSMADSLAAAGYYDDAVTEYYRHIFFHPDADDLGDIYSRAAFCFAEMKQWERAIHDIDLAIVYTQGDSLSENCQVDRAVMLAASGQLENSLSILDRVYATTHFTDIGTRATDLLLLTSVLRYDWQEAAEVMENSSFDTESKAKISDVLLEAMNAEYKSPSKAMMLSSLLPGAGQAYDGRYLSGLNALVLNGLLAYATGHMLLTERYGYAILTFYFGLRRYFEGNRNNAYIMAQEYNRKIDERLKDRLTEILTNKKTPDSLK